MAAATRDNSTIYIEPKSVSTLCRLYICGLKYIITCVLNTRTTVKRTPYGYTGIDDARVEILAKAIEKYGNCEIILSSDWKELNEKHEDYRNQAILGKKR